MGEILTKTVFSLQSEPNTAKFCFLLFWSILEEIHGELLFLVQKVTISERSTEMLKFFFKRYLKSINPEENLDLFKQLFLVKPVKWENLTKPCCFPQSEPHTAKLCFSVVLKHFFGKFTEKFSFYSKKRLSRKGALKYLEFFFS